MEVPIIKILSVPQRIVAAPVYIGGAEPDGQGDVASPVEVFKALLSHTRSKAMKIMHTGPNRTGNEIKILSEYMTGKEGYGSGAYFVPPFCWVIVARLSPELFAKVQKGQYTGFSMSGCAVGRTET